MLMSLGLGERLFLLYIPELNLLSQTNLVRAELFFTPVVYMQSHHSGYFMLI